MRLRESVALAGGVFAFYALGACPTVYVGDSGELVTAAHVLGIPHPSGYPLYVLLGKLWTVVVPVGSIAYRMSLFSAACAAAACGVLHALCGRIGLHPVAAAVGALLLAVSPSLWGEANVQRVYALNALFTALATAAAFSWRRLGRDRDLVLAFGLCGLGASNHTFMALYAVALAAFVTVVEPGLRRRPAVVAWVGAAFVAGLLPYLYLPLRSRSDPPLDWGNPETLGNLLGVVLRREYWDRAWVEAPRDVVVALADYVASFGRELFVAGAALAVWGVLAGRRRWPVALVLLVMIANAAAVAFHGSYADIFRWHRYYIPSYVLAALLAAMGCHALVERLPPRARFLPLVLPALGLVSGWREFDRSRYRIAEDYSRTLLGSLPPGARLAASDDNVLFPLLYLHWVEGLRPDLELIPQGVGTELPPTRFDPDTDPLFFTHHPNWNAAGLEVVPVGLVFRPIRAGQAWPRPHVGRAQLAGEDDPRVPKDYLTRNLVGHFHFMRGMSVEAIDWPRAAHEYARAARAAPENDVLFYNLGLVYQRNGLLEEALASFRRAAELNPRAIPGGGRPRPSDRVRETAAEVERLQSLESEMRSGLPPRGTAAYHHALAERLEGRGERSAARGHRLRAEVLAGR